ncbi:penicillin-binding protein activator [Halotalea alkalilenta]|uniref:penicillin-binding protein activator n=1 Tax=Halotalea alkalilenta TaxID=376489 RepID=UPI0005BE6A7B|nr:penicillin-binding protein activator [Halotalea alkalilenta]
MRDALQRLSGLTLTAVILGGCAGGPSFTREPSSDALLDQAQQQQGEEAALSRLQAADILARGGSDAQALGILNNIDPRTLSDAGRARWALLTAEVALRQNDGRTALEATATLDDGTRLDDSQRQRLQAARGLAYGALGDHLQAVSMLLQAQRNSGDDPRYNDDVWSELAQLNAAELERLPNPDALSDGWLTLAQLRLQSSGDPNAFAAQIDNWRAAYPTHPASRNPPSELTALHGLQDQAVSRIAVLLPQSGSLSTVANAIRHGMEVARQSLADAGQSAPQLDFIDSSAGNIDALYAQASSAGAQVVIGPLDKEQVTQLEQRSQVPMPTLALNYGNSASNQAQGLYQYGLSAEDEARQVATRAANDGRRSADVMVPNNDWGSRVLEAFRQQWQARGNSVLNVSLYDPGAPVSQTVSQLMRAGTPDMLFVLALPPYARQISPNLQYYGVQDLPIYATSHVYAGQPAPNEDNDLNGVMFPTIPWELPELGGVDSLPYADVYRRLSSDEEISPSMLKINAMGVDAFELARRLPLYQALPSSETQGATGLLRLSQDRRFERQLPWAVFRNGSPAAP